MISATSAPADVSTPRGVADGALSHQQQNGNSLAPAIPSGIQPLTEAWNPPPQAVASAKPGFTVWRYHDFLHYVPPVDDALLAIKKDETVLWRDCETALLVGPGGVGKSRLAMQLAIAQILREPWLGLVTYGQPRRWLFIGNENSRRRQKEDLLAMMAGRTPEQIAHVAVFLQLHAIVTPEDADIELAPVAHPNAGSTAEPSALERWEATIAREKPGVLVVDPWEAAIAGGDANDSAATRETLGRIKRILHKANPRASLLIIHHSREGAAAFRQAVGFDASAFIKGSKSLRSMARFQINVAPAQDDDSSRVVVACGKSNNCTPFAPRGAVLNKTTMTYAVDESFDLAIWKESLEGTHAKSDCTAIDVWELVQKGTTKTADIVQFLSQTFLVSGRTAKRRLDNAIEKGYIVRTKPPGHHALGDRRPHGR